uniref:Uncharacterized protein n=1 Tax=Clastoptera arizonana TaxID=38151 RepID=A0A1B6D6H9_9HEMI
MKNFLFLFFVVFVVSFSVRSQETNQKLKQSHRVMTTEGSSHIRNTSNSTPNNRTTTTTSKNQNTVPQGRDRISTTQELHLLGCASFGQECSEYFPCCLVNHEHSLKCEPLSSDLQRNICVFEALP